MVETNIAKIPYFLEYLRDQFSSKSLDGEVYGNHILHLLEYPPIDTQEPISFLIDSGFDELEATKFWELLQSTAKNSSLNEEQIDHLCDRGILWKHYDDTGVYQLYLSAPEDINTSTISNEIESDEKEDEEEEEEIVQEMDWMYYVDQIENTLQLTYQCTQEFSAEAMYFALYKTNYDIMLSAQLLLYNVQILNACKPCRHYLQHACYRKDCMFEHHLENYPCRFWLYSHCTNISPSDTSNVSGTKCLFAHDLTYFDDDYLHQYYASLAATTTPITTTTHVIPTKEVEEWPEISTTEKVTATEHFPTLSQSTTTSTNKKQKQNTTLAKEKKASVPAYKAAVQTVSSSTAPSSAQSVSVSSSSSSCIGATSSSSSSSHSNKKNGFGELLSEHHFILSVHHAAKNPTATKGNSMYRLKSDPSEWVASGDTLRHDYETLRQEARDYAISRNKLLQEASIAFLSGSKDIARSLSQQGQLLNQHMKACHMQAAKAIFRKRNSLSDLQQGRIDIHGLHVQEAIDCLEELIPLYQQYGYKQVRVVTGSGHHTKGPQEGKARLQPAVKQLFEEDYKYHVKDIKDASGYVGGMVVDI